MPHSVFIRHTYIYKCSYTVCEGEWKINEAQDLDRLRCPRCGKYDSVEYKLIDQREKYIRAWV